MRSATDCIARTVAADPRFRQPGTDLGDLIVDSMSTCMPHVRAMIAAYDRYFGEGAGEAFFMGPYLDVLPTAVSSGQRQTEQVVSERRSQRGLSTDPLTSTVTAARRRCASWSGRPARPDFARPCI